MTNDKIILREKGNALQVLIRMESIIPCIKAIQQYDPSFEPQDILKEKKFFSETMFESITENFNDCLYCLIEETRDYKENTQTETKINTNDLLDLDLEFEPLELDFKELEL